MPYRRAEVLRLLRLAQSGSAEEALAGVTRHLSDAEPAGNSPQDREWAPALYYVRGVAQHCLGDHRAALVSANDVVRVALVNGKPDWVSIGRLLSLLQRVVAEPTQDLSGGDALLQDLAAAEAALPPADGEPFAVVTAYANIGRCYTILRLYELARPHFEAAIDIIAANLPLLRVAAVTMQLNLAELHGSWAMELRRIGRTADAAEHELSARRHAQLAVDQPEDLDTDAYRAKGRLIVAWASADIGDPLEAAARIRSCVVALAGRGLRSDLSTALMHEARALARADHLDEALDAARRACAALPTDAVPALTAAVLHCRALLVVRQVSDGEILAYGDYLALVLADQRERTLDLARSMQMFERLRRERERMQQLAYTDALTGLGNRHALDRYVSQLVDRPQEELSVAIIDVDDLKLANDVRGHDAGDEILRVIAIALMGQAGAGDFVARLGGDEFVWVARDRPASEGIDVAVGAQLSTALLGQATVSVGVARGPAVDFAGLLRHADGSMYDAKRARRAARMDPFPDRAPAPR